ncbi:JMJD4 (predicted) [Pycnogonum litorale]
MDPYVSKATFAYATERQPSHFRVTSHDELDIVRIEKAVTYEEFFVKYLLRNVPCILSSSFTDEWKCRQEWMDDNNEINTEFLSKKFGDVIVPIADCDTHQYNAQVKSDMLFKQFLEWWKARSKNQKSPNDKEKNLYLKDWHFPKLFNEYEAYVTPDYFSSDWLNEFFDDLEDDYRFLYMGPKGSWTPFHADVYKSNSWSANVCGKKRWHLFPPGYESHFKDLNENLAYSIFSPELEDQRKYPTYSKLKLKRGFEVTQCSGEIIFVPSGWYHEVYNIEDTISINHNWFNACNIDFVWEALQQGLLNVEKEISDCSDADTFTEDCQVIQ